jgi:hypothetical protein
MSRPLKATAEYRCGAGHFTRIHLFDKACIVAFGSKEEMEATAEQWDEYLKDRWHNVQESSAALMEKFAHNLSQQGVTDHQLSTALMAMEPVGV